MNSVRSVSEARRALPVSNDSVTAARQRLPVCAPNPVPASQRGEGDDSQEPQTLLQIAQHRGKQLLAGWATSLLLHLFLLVGLALFSFGNASSQLGLELAFSDAEEAVDLEDVQFEMPALDEPDFSESLEVSIPEEALADPVLEFEDPVTLADSLIEPAASSLEPAAPASGLSLIHI